MWRLPFRVSTELIFLRDEHTSSQAKCTEVLIETLLIGKNTGIKGMLTSRELLNEL